MNTEVAIPAFIDKLCTLRNTLIEQQTVSLKMFKQAVKTCEVINALVPACDDALPDMMESIFYDAKGILGEISSGLPKVASIRDIDENLINELARKVVDKRLWLMLFNRLNLNSLLSGDARTAMYYELDEECPIFTPEVVEATLADLYSSRHEKAIEALFDVVCAADKRYKSNSRSMFKSKTVFSDAIFLQNGAYFKPQLHGHFREMLKFLSMHIFGESTRTEGVAVKRDYLFALVSEAFQGYQVTSANGIEVIFAGGKIRFFNKGNAHLILEPNMVDYLNAQLSKSQAIKC